MLKSIKSHLKGNRGDANVSKMTIIAIAFVVGAILLVLTTSAFRNPINRWFSNVTGGWFANENGGFAYNDPFLTAERLENGTFKGAEYRLYDEDGSYMKLEWVSGLTNGRNHSGFTAYNADGSEMHPGMDPINGYHDVLISEDGKTINVSGMEFTAYFPNN